MRGHIAQAMGLFTDARHFKLRLFMEGNIIGISTGLLIALFRYLLECSEQWLPVWYGWLAQHPVMIAGWFLVLAGVGWILYAIVRWDATTSGSGIPQIKGVLLGKMDMRRARVIVLKFIGAVLGIGAGLSLGREGPSVQLGACLGQGLGRITHRSYAEGRYLLTAGAGAGLAAAFNAPLAGVIFCLEELTKNFSPFVLMSAVAATVLSTTVTQFFFGMEPVFHMGVVPVVSTGDVYFLLVLLGIFVGGLGLMFNRMLLVSLDSYARAPLRSWMKPMVPLFAAGGLGFLLPAVLGGGSPLVDSLVVTDYPMLFLLVLLAGKFLFTMLCFGSGVPGGIFLPMLVLGAIGGAVFAKGAVFLGLMSPAWTLDCIVFGMAAYFSAVVKAPVTGSILIMEMTGSFEHMLALILVSMTAFLVADFTGGEPVYDVLLSRSLRARERIAQRIRHRRIMTECVVGAGSSLDGAYVREADWPSGTLLVNVKRGLSELVPEADLQLQSGDYMYVLIDEQKQDALKDLSKENC